jgi:hypothetical protein
VHTPLPVRYVKHINDIYTVRIVSYSCTGSIRHTYTLCILQYTRVSILHTTIYNAPHLPVRYDIHHPYTVIAYLILQGGLHCPYTPAASLQCLSARWPASQAMSVPQSVEPNRTSPPCEVQTVYVRRILQGGVPVYIQPSL